MNRWRYSISIVLSAVVAVGLTAGADGTVEFAAGSVRLDADHSTPSIDADEESPFTRVEPVAAVDIAPDPSPEVERDLAPSTTSASDAPASGSFPLSATDTTNDNVNPGRAGNDVTDQTAGEDAAESAQETSAQETSAQETRAQETSAPDASIVTPESSERQLPEILAAGGEVQLSPQAQDVVDTLDLVVSGTLPESRFDAQQALQSAEPAIAVAGLSVENPVALTGQPDWQPGEPIEITMQTIDGLVAFEGAVQFDATLLEFGGVEEVAGVDVRVADAGSVVAVSATLCDTARCPDTSLSSLPTQMRLRFAPIDAGVTGHAIVLSGIEFVSVSGEVIRPAPQVVTVGVDAEPLAAVEAWTLPAATPASTPVASDVNDDGRSDAADLAEISAAWSALRQAADPCPAEGLADARLDSNLDGCVTVSDVSLLASRLSAPAPTRLETRTFDPYSWPSRTGTPTFTVNSTGDELDVALSDNVCLTATGTCTLRAAIQQANAQAGPNRIVFALPGAGPHQIQIVDRLPIISDVTGGVTIDGYSQPGSVVNDHPSRSDAQIKIELIGPVNAAVTGLHITSELNVVRGLSFRQFRYGVYLDDDGASRNHIVGNFIGIDPTATMSSSASNMFGVFASDGAKFNVVGTPAPGDRNVISGTGGWAMRLDGGGTDGNMVWNNIIGLSPDGESAIVTDSGIDIQWRAEFNMIGGPNAGEGNVFGGLFFTAVDLSHEATENYVIGNLIGTDLAGTGAPDYASNYYGILFKDDAELNSVIGNVIANSQEDGLWHKHNYTGPNLIADNYVGVTLDGSPAPNNYGVYLSGHDDVYVNNVIAHNRLSGIFVHEGTLSGANVFDERTVGNRFSRNTMYGNGGLGIDIAPEGPNNNDSADLDDGPNDQLNTPEFATAIVGSVTGMACSDCVVEIFLADEFSDTTQGQMYLGSVRAATDGTFEFGDARLAPRRRVTATATDGFNNTSEMTPFVIVAGIGTTGPNLPSADVRPDAPLVAVTDTIAGSDGFRLETLSTAVGRDWVEVQFTGTFNEPVAVCTVRQINNSVPVVVRMANVSSTSMDIKLQNPGDASLPVVDTVDCLVVEEGAGTLPNGTPFEAVRVDVAAPDHRERWDGQRVALQNTFGFPIVVLGQVMTTNDDRWSTFWSRGNAVSNPPTATNLRVGYHVGEDPDQNRLGETIGVIAFDSIHDSIDGNEFELGRTADSISGPAFTAWEFAAEFDQAPEIVIASQSAMDGGDGGWAVLRDVVSPSSVGLAINEDQIADDERVHTTEMVGYAAFSSPGLIEWGSRPDVDPDLVAWDDFERTTFDSWGLARYGGHWKTLHSATASEQFDVDARGHVEVTPGLAYEAVLQAVWERDVDTTVVATVDTDPDANFDVNVHQRWRNSRNFYRGRVRLQADNSVRVQLIRVDNGVYTNLGALNVPGLTFTPGQDLAIRMRSVGDDVSTVELKVWDARDPEPVGWSITRSDDASNLQRAGSVGLRFQVQSRSSVDAAMFSIDDLIVTHGQPADAPVSISTTDVAPRETYRFDFGTATSPVEPGWIPVSGTTNDDLVSWSGGSLTGLDRGASADTNAVTRDIVFSRSARTLNLAVGDGTWNVTLQMGDSTARDRMAITAEGLVVIDSFATEAGRHPYVTRTGPLLTPTSFEVVVTDGILNIGFDDTGGVDPNWVVNSLVVSEAELYSDESNRALAGIASQSSMFRNVTADRAIDGITDGRGEARISHTLSTLHAWWQVDLGNNARIDEIVIWNRTDCCSGRLSNFEVFVSPVPFGNRTYNELVADPTVWSTHVDSMSSASLELSANTVGRYVRVQLAGTNFLSLAEVQVFGTELPS